MIYIEAVHRLFDAPTVHIDYTVNQGIYTEIKGIRSFDAASIAKIKREMDTLIQDNSPIKKNIVPKLEAVNIFKQQKNDTSGHGNDTLYDSIRIQRFVWPPF